MSPSKHPSIPQEPRLNSATVAGPFQRLLWLATLVCLLLATALSCYFLWTSPVAFQKSVSVTCVQPPAPRLAASAEPIDIEAIVSRIPYQTPGGMVYQIDPRAKYQQTIEQGHGNCSNLVFGLAYHLEQQGREYQIVHLIPPDGFLQGNGHTVLRVCYQYQGAEQQGIVDLLEGGLPTSAGKPIDLEDLREGQLTDAAIVPLNDRSDMTSPYYGEFLDQSVVGLIEHEELKSYFDFIEASYLPLGNEKIEKLVYDGLAVVVGKYPAIVVREHEYAKLFQGHQITKALAFILLYSLRALMLLVPLQLAMRLSLSIRRRFAGSGKPISRRNHDCMQLAANPMKPHIQQLDARWYPQYTDNWDNQLFRLAILDQFQPDSVVLDLGAGAGIVKETRFGGECRGAAAHVAGVDPDPRVLQNPYLDEAAIGVGEQLPFAEATFDVVFSNNVLEHLDAPEAVFAEVFRVLKPGGTFIAKTPNRWHYVPLIAQLTPHWFHRWINHKRGREREDTFPTRYRANSPRAVRRICEETGFSATHCQLHEGRPEYLRFNRLTYFVGRTYERLVNSSSRLAWARGVLIMVATKPVSAESRQRNARAAA